jgi:hypothetical protein
MTPTFAWENPDRWLKSCFAIDGPIPKESGIFLPLCLLELYGKYSKVTRSN